MKMCAKCKIEKEDSEFGFRKLGETKLQSYCKECHSVNWKKWYPKNKKQRIKYCSDLTRQSRKELSAWMSEYKRGKPCKDCLKSYNPWVMEFDHLDGHKKTKNVSVMVARNFSKKSILKEISKCELVCANCHRERTWQRHLSKI